MLGHPVAGDGTCGDRLANQRVRGVLGLDRGFLHLEEVPLSTVTIVNLLQQVPAPAALAVLSQRTPAVLAVSATLLPLARLYARDALSVLDVGASDPGYLSRLDWIPTKVAVDAKVDESLLGGLVVKVGSRMVDTSLKTKLSQLRLAMKGVG